MPSESLGLGPVDFSTFIVSLASNVMMHLGDDSSQPNLELAKHTIDILSMLETKTAGNLTEDEDKLLKGALYQVRMSFIGKQE